MWSPRIHRRLRPLLKVPGPRSGPDRRSQVTPGTTRSIFTPGSPADIREAGQERLLNARALVIGLGGWVHRRPCTSQRAASAPWYSVTTDRVEPSNLQRQIIHREADIGELKAASAQRTPAGINR